MKGCGKTVEYEYQREVLASNIADSLIFTDDETQIKIVVEIEKIDSVLADCIKSKIILL